MRKLLMFIVMAWLPIAAYCDKLTVNLEKEGTLEEVITNQDVLKITELTVTGRFTAEDLIYLRENLGTGRITNLETLDLKDVTLIASETPYIKDKYKVCYFSDEEHYEYENRNGSISAGGFWMEGANYTFASYYGMDLPYAFSGMALKKVVLPSSVHKLGVGCFTSSQVVEVEAPGGLTAIEESAFYNCSNLKLIPSLANVDRAGSKVFGCCSSLESCDLGNFVEIGAQAFEKCKALTSIGSLAKLKKNGYGSLRRLQCT